MGRTKLQAKVEPAPKRWLNKQEAMAYLGVGEDYLSKLRNELLLITVFSVFSLFFIQIYFIILHCKRLNFNVL